MSQVQQYLRGISDKSGLPLERLAGCAFDGSLIVYVMWERGIWHKTRPNSADPTALGALVDTLESLARGRGLMAENLHEDFGRGSDTAGRVIRAFIDVLQEQSPSSRAMVLFEEWRLDLGNASGPFSSSNKKEFERLCADLGIDPSNTDREIMLFALQTYFALVVKLVSVVILEGTTGESLFEGLTGPSDIREALGDLA